MGLEGGEAERRFSPRERARFAMPAVRRVRRRSAYSRARSRYSLSSRQFPSSKRPRPKSIVQNRDATLIMRVFYSGKPKKQNLFREGDEAEREKKPPSLEAGS